MGDGYEQSLDYIDQVVPISTVHKIPSGTKVGSWTVPQAWSVKEAWIATPDGEKIINFDKSPHCLWQYSTSTDEVISHSELMERLAVGQGNNIPLVVTYYKKRWGFSISEEQKKLFTDREYRVYVDVGFHNSDLNIGEITIPGSSPKEVVIDAVLSCCSLANNISGVVAAVYVAKLLMEYSNLNYTYRILFTPETIGPIALHHTGVVESSKVVGGFNLINLADNANIQYKSSRYSTLVDQAIAYELERRSDDFQLKEYDVRTGTCGNEKAYNSLGIEIPLGALRRSELCSYPEYDTSGDNMNYISQQQFYKSLDLLEGIIDSIESNLLYKHEFEGEPFLTGYGLFPKIESDRDRIPYDYLMGFTDGKNTLIDLANRSGLDLEDFKEPVRLMMEKDLLSVVQ